MLKSSPDAVRVVRMRRWGPLLAGALAISGVAQVPPAAALTPDDGRSLAQQYCSACHRVARSQPAPAPVTTESGEEYAAPSFRRIAARDDLTAAQLRDKVLRPHYPMREQLFIPEELDAILAYIVSLRATTGAAADW